LIHRFIWESDLDAANCLAGFDHLVDEILGPWEAA
jgi:hypothetical protein